jgi:hypothetical protein
MKGPQLGSLLSLLTKGHTSCRGIRGCSRTVGVGLAARPSRPSSTTIITTTTTTTTSPCHHHHHHSRNNNHHHHRRNHHTPVRQKEESVADCCCSLLLVFRRSKWSRHKEMIFISRPPTPQSQGHGEMSDGYCNQQPNRRQSAPSNRPQQRPLGKQLFLMLLLENERVHTCGTLLSLLTKGHTSYIMSPHPRVLPKPASFSPTKVNSKPRDECCALAAAVGEWNAVDVCFCPFRE